MMMWGKIHRKSKKSSSLLFSIFLVIILLLSPITSTVSSVDDKTIIESQPSQNEITATPLGWSEDIRLSYFTNPNASIYPRNYSVYPRIAASGDVLHAVWETDQVNEWNFLMNGNITYARSSDNGRTWSEPIYLSNMTGGDWDHPMLAMTPKIVVNGNNIHVVWVELRDSFSNITYRRSTDGGLTWEPIIIIPNQLGLKQWPDIAVWNNNIFIIWEKGQIFYSNSTDNGATWSNPTQLTNMTTDAGEPIIGVANTNIHLTFLVWYNGGSGFAIETFYMNSTDSGLTWSEPTLLTPADGRDSVHGSIKVNSSKVNVVIDDERD